MAIRSPQDRRGTRGEGVPPAPRRRSRRRLPPLSRRRSRLLTRTLPLVVFAAGSFGFGVYEAGSSGRAARKVVQGYVRAWERGDFHAMYRMLEPSSRRHLSEAAFTAAYARAATTATLTSVGVYHVRSASGGRVSVRMLARTRLFGGLRETLQIQVDTGGSDGVEYSPALVFPGLRPGERLTRHTSLPARGALLADDGTPLAQGPQRTSPIPAVSDEIVGTLGPIPADARARYAALGYPANAPVGQNGLELIFQRRLAGRIGGTLRAGHRVLASVAPVAGSSVRTTINPAIEQAAIDSLGGSYAGMTVMDPRDGALLALAGIAFSAVQPPGSTFKIVTAVGALEAGIATPSTEYPVESTADIDGYTLQNAGGEACGGTLLYSFATSCDTVFAPLGLQLGAQRLVSTAVRFGFDQPTGIAGAIESTIPSAATIGDGVAVGSSAIGQGEVQASTLEVDDIGATIAEGGRRPLPTLVYGAKRRFAYVTTGQVAGEVQQMMEAVVEYGTGTPAQIPGVQVAGKTGTAELADTANQQNDKSETDAWFVGYAPAGAARVVACALFPSSGYGADTAAPAVRQVLEAALATKY